jgi:hypothetical protein
MGLLDKLADALRSPYDPNPTRRAAVTKFLSGRTPLTDAEWHSRFAASEGIPLEFVVWFREMCSKNFEFDLSGALPDDKLREDLGMNEATWGDTSWDLIEDYEEHFGVKLPDRVVPPVTTFGQLLKLFWENARTRGKVC